LADVRQIMTALELSYNDNNSYPTATTNAPTSTFGTPAFSTLLASWPTAPLPADGTCTDTNGSPTGNRYTYAQVSSGSSYTLNFCLGAATGGYALGYHTASPSGIN